VILYQLIALLPHFLVLIAQWLNQNSTAVNAMSITDWRIVSYWARSSVVKNKYQTITKRRDAFTSGQLFARFRKWAGVSGRTFHDLRCLAMTEMSNSGATNAEIVSFYGHSITSPVVATYVIPDKETASNTADKRWKHK
jgi:hypothetical protein